MPSPIALVQGQIYHIFNRGNNRETIFCEERNYIYFLNLYAKYIPPIADTYAYCLLPNHFHLLVRIKSAEEIYPNVGLADNIPNPEQLTKMTRKYPSLAFSNLFNAYTKSFNKVNQRTGSLLEKPFHRKLVASDAYFQQLVLYIHHNPEKHGLVDDFRQWRFSSYRSFISDRITHVEREVVREHFGGREAFDKRHEEYQADKYEDEF